MDKSKGERSGMKKFYLLLLTLTLALGTAAAEPAATEPAAVEPTAEESGWTRNLNNVGRGAANIVTCFLEIPRCMVYRNSQVPFWGFIDGAVRGSGLTVLRAFSGVTFCRLATRAMRTSMGA